MIVSDQVSHQPPFHWVKAGVLIAIAAAAICVAFVPAMLPASEPIRPPARIELEAASKAAYQRNLEAENALSIAAQATLLRHDVNLRQRAHQVAAELSSFNSAMNLGWMVARDTVKRETSAKDFVHRELVRAFDASVRGLAAEFGAPLAKFDVAMAESTSLLACDLAQASPEMPARAGQLVDQGGVSVRVPGDLSGLGMSAVIVPLDILTTGPVASIASSAATLPTRLFARGAGTAATGAVLPAVDGPFPFGDLIAVGFLGVSLFEVIQARGAWAGAIAAESERLAQEIGKQAREEVRARVDMIKQQHLARQKMILDSAANGGTR